MESFQQFTEAAASVKTQKYSWGTMKTVHHGASFSIPLHPEHHQAIHKLKDGESHHFTDETKSKWKATREGDKVHFHGEGSGNRGYKTTVAHEHMKEDVNHVAEEKDTIERDAQGKLKSWKHEGDWHKSAGGTTTDKSGAKHTPYSKARDLARTALKKTLTKEEAISEESGAYEKAEENKRSADSAKKQGDMFAHHLHMADHHDNLAQWHGEKGRHNVADQHARKSEEHHEKAMKLKESAPVAPSIGVHRIGVTVSDPNHPAVTQRKEKLQKFVRVTSNDKDKAIEQGKKHFAKKGWKVHGAEHAGMVHEEVQIDEAKSPQQQMDFDRMMKGAMSRAEYNTKWKKPLKSDSKVIYGKNVKEEAELEEVQIDELSNATLQSYKDKAMKSADELAAKGQHSKANDRYMKHMQASGKQIDRTMKNIHKAMQQRQNEDVDLEEATQEELRAALNRHSERAVEANKRGDDAAVKMHQERMNKVKDKMAKLARNQ